MISEWSWNLRYEKTREIQNFQEKSGEEKGQERSNFQSLTFEIPQTLKILRIEKENKTWDF